MILDRGVSLILLRCILEVKGDIALIDAARIDTPFPLCRGIAYAVVFESIVLRIRRRIARGIIVQRIVKARVGNRLIDDITVGITAHIRIGICALDFIRRRLIKAQRISVHNAMERYIARCEPLDGGRAVISLVLARDICRQRLFVDIARLCHSPRCRIPIDGIILSCDCIPSRQLQRIGDCAPARPCLSIRFCFRRRILIIIRARDV